MTSKVINKTNVAIKYSFIFKSLQQIISLVAGIMLARILTPEEFGIIAIANMVIYYANNFTNLGLNNALIQRTNINTKHIDSVFTLDVLISLALVILTFMSAGYISIYFGNVEIEPVLKWMSLYYVITAFHSIPDVLLRRNIDFKFINILDFFKITVTSCLVIYLARKGYSYWAVVISTLLVQTVVTTTLIIKAKWVPRFALSRELKDIYSFGCWSFIRSQIQLLVSKVDYFVIGRYMGVHCLGLYEKSFELTDRAMTGVAMPLNSIFFSTFSMLKHDNMKIKQVFLEASQVLTIICYPVLFGLLGIAPHFVMSCLGAQWEQAIITLQVLSVAGIFRVFLGVVASMNIAVGKYKIHTLLSILSAALFVALCFYFHNNSIIYISFSFLIYSFISFCFSFYIVSVTIDISPLEFIKSVWCPFCGAAVMLSLILMSRHLFFKDYSSLLQLLMQVFGGAVFYMIWVYFFYKNGTISFKITGSHS